MVAKMATIVGDVTGLQQRHRPLNIPPLVKGTQSAMGSRWPGHYFCQFEPFTLTRNQSYASDTSRNPLQSCLVSHSILDLLLNRKPLFEQTFAHPITLFYHIFLKNGIQRNTNRKREIDGRGYIYLENQAFSTLNLQQWFRLAIAICDCAIVHLYWCSNSEVFIYVWISLEKSIGEFLMVYKKMRALIRLRVYNHDFGL